MPKRIIDLSEIEFHGRCLRDARGVFELSEHLTMCSEDGFPPEKMSVAEIVEEAREALSYYEDGGLAAEECERGDKQALKDRSELRAFLRKWIPRLEARAAAFHAVRATASK